MAVLTKHFNVQAANIAVLDICLNSSPKYVFVSHPLPWLDPNGLWNDSIIPDANISIQQSETNVYNEMVFGKLITPINVIQMIPRYDWISGLVYTKYSGLNANLYSENFYVVTDDLNVFKVIDNNYDSPSTVKPTVISTEGTFFTIDGYVWKYMYTIPSDINIRFSTDNYIPVVANASVIANAVPGTVDTIDITSFGTNYKAFYSGYLENSVNGFVVAIDSNASPYSNFYTGSSMYLKAGFGAGQIRQIIAYDGLNKLIRLNESFDTFTVFSLANVVGTFNIGDTLTQNIDSLALTYYQGVFQVGDTILQSDTSATGTVIGANSTFLQVVRSSANVFSLTYPIYDTTTSGTVAPGTATVQPFTQLLTFSNTAAFSLGEPVYQSNGSANIGTGILFAANTNLTVNTSFEPIISVSPNFIQIVSNPYAVNDQLLYWADTGNTALFPLANNGTYYVSFSNGTGIAISNTSGGANVVLSLTKAETFNANTGINGSNFISIAGNWFVNGQSVVYTVSPGNTIPVGLSSGFTYYAVHANSIGLNLSITPGGPNVSITPTIHSETGHNLTFTIPPEIGHHFSYVQQKLTLTQVNGVFTNSYQVKGNNSHANAILQLATIDANGLAYVYSTNTSQTTFTTSFPLNSYIRIGNNTNLNIRRVVSSNTSCIIVDSPIQPAIANLTYVVPNALEIASYTIFMANGLVVNTDLNTVVVNYSNSSHFGTLYIPGERVDLVNNIGIFQGTYGMVSYSNATSVVITEVNGPGFLNGFYLSGESSLQFSFINNITNYPTITVEAPSGLFVIGQQVSSCSTANLTFVNGRANVITYFTTPGELTEYIISPTVTITGDGTGALAYSTVNTNPTVNFPLANVVIISSGTGYTYANAIISSNLSYGSGATVIAAISPLLGHGYNSFEELGASYVGISVNIANSVLESYYFPMFGNYRKVGILDTPFYNELYAGIQYFDRVKLLIQHSSNTFFPGEVVYQPNSSAAGIVVYSNNTFLELKNVMGTFSAAGLFPNGHIANDNVVGLYSTAVANVSTLLVSHFDIVSDNQVVYEMATQTQAVLTSITGQSNLQLTNVEGLFSAGDMLFDPTINAYGWVNSMHSNAGIDVTRSFGLRFNQTLRIPITSSSAHYQLYEKVTQNITNATGTIIGGAVLLPPTISTNTGNDVDLTYSAASGSFSVGSIIYNSGNVGVGIVISSNSQYLRLSAVSGTFSGGDTITSTISVTATVGNVFPVLILNNVDGDWNSGVLSGNIIGSNTGTVGRCDTFNVILYPDLVRNSGQVMYLENLAPFTLSNTSQESISLIMAF